MFLPLAWVSATAIVFGVKAYRRYEARAERLQAYHDHEQQMQVMKEWNGLLQKTEAFIMMAN
ncbi:hypothetical protein CEF21_07175 [Bacillus sp. FJAT-42376]|nr:hypothetical protein CEF21_07175 [Bacillus sp. FJAT-42376]